MKKNKMTIPLLIATVVTTGLIAGLFYAYSCSVNPGLGNLGNSEYLQAMQSINRAILNPVFFISFMGTLFLLPLSAYMNSGSPVSGKFVLLTIASLVYVIGVFGVTIAGNVPLNNALDTANLAGSSPDQLAGLRERFEGPWNTLHGIRTTLSILSFLLTVIACVIKEK